MKSIIFFLFFLTNCLVYSVPPKDVPKELYDEFTLGKQIPVKSWYLNGTYSSDKPVIYDKKTINTLIQKAKNKKEHTYPGTDCLLHRALEKYSLKDKTVGIIGSVLPWYESVVLANGGIPITVEYNKIISEDPRLKVMTVEEFEKDPIKFDVILSISSIEHDGLGRYGDPINPFGDFEFMKKARSMLNEDGLLILAVPTGRDCLVWNAHRIYGAIRLPLLFQGWELIDSFGFHKKLFNLHLTDSRQPVYILKVKKEN